MPKTGIYRITNTMNGKCYIGSSVDIATRWAKHRSELRHNRHWSNHLQSSWNLYGEEAFVFEIVELCDQDSLLDREQAWIDDVTPEYNKTLSAITRGIGLPQSEEARRKISEANRGRFQGEASPVAKLTTEQVVNIIADIAGGFNDTAISEKYGCSRGTSADIRKSRTWIHLHRPWTTPPRNVQRPERLCMSKERQSEIVGLINKGLNNCQIARMLHCSRNTVIRLRK